MSRKFTRKFDPVPNDIRAQRGCASCGMTIQISGYCGRSPIRSQDLLPDRPELWCNACRSGSRIFMAAHPEYEPVISKLVGEGNSVDTSWRRRMDNRPATESNLIEQYKQEHGLASRKRRVPRRINQPENSAEPSGQDRRTTRRSEILRAPSMAESSQTGSMTLSENIASTSTSLHEPSQTGSAFQSESTASASQFDYTDFSEATSRAPSSAFYSDSRLGDGGAEEQSYYSASAFSTTSSNFALPYQSGGIHGHGAYGQANQSGVGYAQAFQTGGAYEQQLQPGGEYAQAFQTGGAYEQQLQTRGGYEQQFQPGGGYEQQLPAGAGYGRQQQFQQSSASSIFSGSSSEGVMAQAAQAESEDMYGPGGAWPESIGAILQQDHWQREQQSASEPQWDYGQQRPEWSSQASERPPHNPPTPPDGTGHRKKQHKGR